MNRRTNIGEFGLPVRPLTKGVPLIKRAFVYEDHRVILNVLDHLRREEPATFPVNLVYLDYHDDAATPVAQMASMTAARQPGVTQRDFWSFVEWEMDPLDGDWLKTGMSLGLIQDAICIGASDSANNNLATPYTDPFGVSHTIYRVCHIWNGLDPNGWIVDAGRAGVLKPIWDILGWQNVGGVFSFVDDRKGVPAFVLDFDLDYFTSKGPTGIGQLVWPERQLVSAFSKTCTSGATGPSFRAADFLQILAGYSKAITIARESPYCGGYSASNSALEMLDSMLFNGRLTVQGV